MEAYAGMLEGEIVCCRINNNMKKTVMKSMVVAVTFIVEVFAASTVVEAVTWVLSVSVTSVVVVGIVVTVTVTVLVVVAGVAVASK